MPDQAYLLAEKKIEEALKSGATELNFRDIELTELPESIGQLTQLQILDLSYQQLTKIPESLGQLAQLKDLRLSANKLTILPNSLEGLAQLQFLNLSGNKFKSVPLELRQITTLQLLDLSENDLTTIPNWFAQLKQLEALNLSQNLLTELPDWFGQLIWLQSLELYGNQLNILPNSFGNLRRLKTLQIAGNQFRELPIQIKELHNLQELYLSDNRITVLPEWLESLTGLTNLTLSGNPLTSLSHALENLINLQQLCLGYMGKGIQIKELPTWFRSLTKLEYLQVSGCNLTKLPEWLNELAYLEWLSVDHNMLSQLPEGITKLPRLKIIDAQYNQLTNLPYTIIQIKNLQRLNLENNPLNPELAEAYGQGLDAVKAYLRAKEKGEIILNESKLLLVGEGEVGKTCLMDALLDREWQEHPSTHGIEIQQIKVAHIEKGDESSNWRQKEKNITLNGWDFGGQRVYRPTHQLFFSAPAVYLVVWKPREGPQQGFVKEWIQLVKRREPSAKILVVATHGGPQQRQPDIDRQELWDLFGKETVVDFFFVDSKPDEQSNRKGIEELKRAIARVAAALPEVGRSVPKSFADVRAALQATGKPYLPLDEVLAICRAHHMDDEIARLFITISHRLGHLTHYENDPQLRDIVILRPDWLATAMSYVLDDELTRANHGLVKFSRLGLMWDDSSRAADSRYEPTLHPIFARLMDRFDLSYVVADPSPKSDSDPLRLIGQLVPDIRPANLEPAWQPTPSSGDLQQTQICRIVDKGTGQSATAEGLFYQLIVRLHKYSLGRTDYTESVHWQRGLVLDNAYNGRAFLQHVGNDIHITVRAPYPERFLAMLTEEVKYLVESFWEGLRCDVTVPCLNPNPCLGLFEVEKLIENKRRGRPEVPCSICNVWQNTDTLLLNAPAATQAITLEYLQKEFASVRDRIDNGNSDTLRILSQVDKKFGDLIQLYTDEAKEGPRLFSLFPVDGNKFNPQTWVREKFRLVLWCEHSRLPLPALNGLESKKGVYDLEFDRDWFKRAVPFLKFMTGTLSLVLPMMSSTLKVVDDTAFKTLENQLSLGKSVIDFLSGEGTKLGEVMGAADTSSLERGVALRAENATLRELHALLKAKDPTFGNLVRVLNKRNEFLWVHEKFASEY